MENEKQEDDERDRDCSGCLANALETRHAPMNQIDASTAPTTRRRRPSS
jgi:hypothetical protein